MKTKIIPFDLETAKKIQAGEIKGCITTKNDAVVRVICWDRKCYNNYPLVVLLSYEDSAEVCSFYNDKGVSIETRSYECGLILKLELPDAKPNMK